MGLVSEDDEIGSSQGSSMESHEVM